MSFAPGQRLGSYEIFSILGEGGMGVVYRARDAKLGRDVALKILPEIFALDPDRLARFEREARALAAVNHPNIAHVYDSGKDAAGAYLVMELVEGDTLGDVIRAHHASRPSTPDLAGWALPIAKQIIDALEAAHDQGIVHRDLKPANIKVRPDGTVKVLDFGLAKINDPATQSGTGADAAAQERISNSPTLTAAAFARVSAAPGTQMGLILGTAAYMSPEQARGRPVDRRADIWAFGVVLYEMLAGRRAFDGEDISITLAGVLKEDVSWTSLPADLPAPWRRLLKRCLEKDPKRRLNSIADARHELEEAASPNAAGDDAAAAAAANSLAAAALGEAKAAHAAELARVTRGRRIAWILASVFGLTVIAAFAMLFSSRAAPALAPAPRVVFDLTISTSWTGFISPSISPDGRWIAYAAAAAGGPSMIHIRPIGGYETRALPGTEGAASVAWAPDSQSMAFLAGSRFGRVSIEGGVRWLGELQSAAGYAVMPDGDLLAATSQASEFRLWRMPGAGSPPVEIDLPKADGPAAAASFPHMLPDGRKFLYLGWAAAGGDRALYVRSLDGGAPVRIVAADASGAYASGHLFFVRDRVLFAQPFDPDTLQLSGEARRIVDDLFVNPVTGRAPFAVSATGALVYRSGAGDSRLADLAWFDRKGAPAGTAGDGGMIYQFRLSRDGARVAVVETATSTTTFRLSVLDLSNGISSRLNTIETTANDPAWSPDSQSIAYEAIHKGARQMFTQRVGDATPQLAYEDSVETKWLDDWSADGRWLLFHAPRPSKLYAVKPNDPASLKLLLDTPEGVDAAHFSPDGKWIAYQITDAGPYNIWVASFPAFDRRRRVSRQGGVQPMWRGDGRELFYLTLQGAMMSVRVTPTASGGLDLSPPEELFRTPLTNPSTGLDQYSVTADGQKFLVVRPRAAASATQTIQVVVNWHER